MDLQEKLNRILNSVILPRDNNFSYFLHVCPFCKSPCVVVWEKRAGIVEYRCSCFEYAKQTCQNCLYFPKMEFSWKEAMSAWVKCKKGIMTWKCSNVCPEFTNEKY